MDLGEKPRFHQRREKRRGGRDERRRGRGEGRRGRDLRRYIPERERRGLRKRMI